ncbi:rod shape-determining protein MreC [Sphingomonas sp. LY160]|uniref:rod shape-determining protein MreC n=1 Tax=Sphingomonas sp. LY160 TaxID=3095342 RepID=UPI002ADEB1AA|nr:rod shape-determining protein MreC [Sphingomonas sp. LY160]MEA1071049.1 rod shape-determining protein MreC [Sphingomonas sp. LY160]
MAASAGPRPGWSRRAQYSLFFSFLAVLAGLIVGLAMLILSIAAPQSYSTVRGAALDVTAPITGALDEVTTTVAGLTNGAGDYWDAIDQNGQLKRERTVMMRRMVEARAILEENRQLKSALRLREQLPESVATARVVGSSFESPRRFAVITAGSNDGVSIGMPVRAAEGLIGRVVDSGRIASRVLLVSDRANIVPARILRGGQPVISTGRGDGTIDVRPLEVGRNPFKPGDIIVTSGTGGLYPPLVPIGKVIRLDDDGAVAIPIADPSKVSFAVIQRPYQPAALAAAAAPDPEAP